MIDYIIPLVLSECFWIPIRKSIFDMRIGIVVISEDQAMAGEMFLCQVVVVPFASGNGGG